MSKSYVVPNNSVTPVEVGFEHWHVLSLSIKHAGKVKVGEVALSPKALPPNFLMIASDREAAKKRLCDLVDDMFDNSCGHF